MIVKGSRYVGVPYTGVRTVDGKVRKLLHDRKIYTINDVDDDAVEHTVEGEETLDSIAALYYNDERLWWLIADVNDILFGFDIEPGDVLVIPDQSIVR